MEQDKALEELATAKLMLTGTCMALERAIYALMSSHPHPDALNQALQAELHPSKIQGMPPGSLLDAWNATAQRLQTHSMTLDALAQSAHAPKN